MNDDFRDRPEVVSLHALNQGSRDFRGSGFAGPGEPARVRQQQQSGLETQLMIEIDFEPTLRLLAGLEGALDGGPPLKGDGAGAGAWGGQDLPAQ